MSIMWNKYVLANDYFCHEIQEEGGAKERTNETEEVKQEGETTDIITEQRFVINTRGQWINISS